MWENSISCTTNKHFIQEAAGFCPERVENQLTTSITFNHFCWFKLKYIMVKECGEGDFNKDFAGRFQAHFPAAQGNPMKYIWKMSLSREALNSAWI